MNSCPLLCSLAGWASQVTFYSAWELGSGLKWGLLVQQHPNYKPSSLSLPRPLNASSGCLPGHWTSDLSVHINTCHPQRCLGVCAWVWVWVRVCIHACMHTCMCSLPFPESLFHENLVLFYPQLACFFFLTNKDMKNQRGQELDSLTER